MRLRTYLSERFKRNIAGNKEEDRFDDQDLESQDEE